MTKSGQWLSKRFEKTGMTNHPRYCRYHQFVSHSTQDCFKLKNLLQEFLDKKILVVKEEERPRTTNTVSISFGNFGPIEVSKNQPVKEKRWEFRIISIKDEKKKVYIMIEKEKTNSEENKDPKEVKVMNTKLG